MSKKLIYLVSFVFVLSVALTGTARAELVGWWKFDEGSGTTAYDFSGNGNDGTLENAGAMGGEGGMNGMALRFEGGGYVSVGPDPWSSISTQFTIAFWAFGSDTIGNNWGFYAGDAAGRLVGCHIPWDGSVYFDTTSGWERINKAAAENEYKGQWRHWTFLKNADTGDKEIYLDGVLWYSGTGFTQAIVGVDRFFIGAGDNGVNPYTGLIDDFRLYDHALSEAEILGAMTGEPWPYAFGPVPKDGAYLEDTWVSMNWSPGDLAVSHDVYIGDNFDDVSDSAESTFQGNQTSTFFVVGFPGFPYPDGLVPGTTYYWRIDEVNDTEPNSPWKSDVWSFSIPPKTAYAPNPANSAELVDLDVTLSWTAGFGAVLNYVIQSFNFLFFMRVFCFKRLYHL
ncbi:MAG TPA: LamG-like jellyroll fold domain-containing protein [Sedimentisphaerales bacterium]|nr:LamG-like jellyroll fold domain-containing protein [Sedimentisphaerales bacterium]